MPRYCWGFQGFPMLVRCSQTGLVRVHVTCIRLHMLRDGWFLFLAEHGEGREVDGRDIEVSRLARGLSKPEIVMINQHAAALARQAWDLCRVELMRQAQAMKAAGVGHLDEDMVAGMTVEFSVRPAMQDDKPF